jgi:NADH:ubiquinone oxidoreductase subunit H
MTLLFFNHFSNFVFSSLVAPVFSAHLSGSGVLVHGSAYLSTLLCLIIVIAFFTVLERKLLAAIQRRSGPNMSSL